MRIEGFVRQPQRRGHLFDDLPPDQEREASRLLAEFLRRHPHRPGWLYPILIGQAKRLARTTPEERSRWGRRMLAKRGGYAVQRSYVAKGRTGAKHPGNEAARVSANRRCWRKMEHRKEWTRQAIGLPPKTRNKILPYA
jgi:hypothetical protein